MTTDPLDPSVLAKYAVLRRPAVATDQPPPLNSLADQVNLSLGRYNPAYIRQLTQRPGGRRFFLVPGLSTAPCLPDAVRPRSTNLGRQQAESESELIACVVTIAPLSSGANDPSDITGGGDNCPSLREVTKYEYLATDIFESGEQAGILPDGIATVRVHFSKAPTLQVPVVENFYLYKPGRAERRKTDRELRGITKQFTRKARTKAQRRERRRRFAALFERLVRRSTPTTIELLAADGRLVKKVRRPKSPELGLSLSADSAL